MIEPRIEQEREQNYYGMDRDKFLSTYSGITQNYIQANKLYDPPMVEGVGEILEPVTPEIMLSPGDENTSMTDDIPSFGPDNDHIIIDTTLTDLGDPQNGYSDIDRSLDNGLENQVAAENDAIGVDDVPGLDESDDDHQHYSEQVRDYDTTRDDI